MFRGKYLRGEKMTREDFDEWVRIVGQIIDENSENDDKSSVNTYNMVIDIDAILAGIFDHDAVVADN